MMNGRGQRSVLLALLAIAGSGCAAGQVAAAPPAIPQSTDEVAAQPYERRGWGRWVDADHDCQNTRNEVLIAESEVPVEFTDSRHCKVGRGRWTCPYTGRVVTDPGALDIDHLIPLENAHRSGGWRWSAERKEAFANDLRDPEHLVAVTASANRSKGSKSPDRWLPENTTFVCEYVRDWQQVKARWGLAMEPTEQSKVQQILNDCRRVEARSVTSDGTMPRREL